MYADGATIREIDTVIGSGYKAQALVERFIAERRPAVPRDQTGERNGSWRGSGASYTALHLRVAAARGKPSRCEQCGTGAPDVRYEWANLTGRYDNVADYERMCVPCHRTYDAARRRLTGERTSPPRGVMSYV